MTAHIVTKPALIKARPTKSGKYRVYGYLNRVWIATPITPGPLTGDSILKIKGIGNVEDEVFASQVQFG